MTIRVYCFVPPFCKDKFCGVPSQAIIKVRCVVGKKSLRNTELPQQLTDNLILISQCNN
jgi:hypothetical protein